MFVNLTGPVIGDLNIVATLAGHNNLQHGSEALCRNVAKIDLFSSQQYGNKFSLNFEQVQDVLLLGS